MEITRGRTDIRHGTLLLDGVATAPAGSTDIIFAAKWSATKPDTALVFTCRVGDGIQVTGSTGAFILTISSAKTALLPASNERLVLVYELIYKVSATEAYQIDGGTLYVKPSVLETV